MFEVDSGFIGNFKTGDNINFNLRCLTALYDAQRSMDPSKSVLLCKPITITLASIVEALLHDLFFRMKNFTTESVNNIAEEVLSDVQKKTLDKLETYIAAARKHKLFGPSSDDLYKKLDKLRKVRNRVHIQNVKQESPRDEEKIFTLDYQNIAEEILETLLKYCSYNYLRPEHVHGCVGTFFIPWDQHLHVVTTPE
jgi:hypothetical protein